MYECVSLRGLRDNGEGLFTVVIYSLYTTLSVRVRPTPLPFTFPIRYRNHVTWDWRVLASSMVKTKHDPLYYEYKPARALPLSNDLLELFPFSFRIL